MATKKIALPNRVQTKPKIHQAPATKTVTKGNPAKSVPAVPSHGGK